MSLNNNTDNSSNNLFNSTNNFNFNYRNLSNDCNDNKNIILKVNPNIKSTGINFQGIRIEEINGNCQYLTLNAHPDFSSLSLEELRYNDYSLNQSDFASNLKTNNININKESNNVLLNNDDKDNNNLGISNIIKFKNNEEIDEEIDEDNKDGFIPNEDFKMEMSDNYNNSAKKNDNSLILLNNTSNNIKSERLLYPENFPKKISIIKENKFNNSSYTPRAVFCENKKNLNDSRNFMNFFHSKTFNDQIRNNDAPFLNNNLCNNSNRINDENDNDISEQNDNNGSSINMNMNNGKNSLVINMDKNKKNKINIEINDNKINIKINDDINIDINSNNSSLSINTNNININSKKNSISINTNNNAINNKSNFQSINVDNSRKNNFINSCKNIFNNKDFNIKNLKFQSVNDDQKKVSNIFSLINIDENYKNKNEQNIHSSENKNNYERSNSYEKILKMNNLESNLMMNSIEKSSEMIKVNMHLKEPYNLSFKLDIKKSITILELKKKIYQLLAQLNKEFISLNNNSFFLMKDYNFIKEFGRIDESNICDGDDIYIILKENIKKCQNEE
jgi:hypothetical protein